MEQAATSEIITNNFYLTGGTALSEFYLQHRLSEDLDFFSEQKLPETEIFQWVKNTATNFKVETTIQTLREQLSYFFNFPEEVIKVDFAYYPFSMLGTPMKFKNLKVSSIEDIAVNKLQAILTRNRGRDYFDLFEIISKKHSTINQLIKGYKLKFDVGIPPEQLAKRFTAVLDASDQPKFLEKNNWKEVENFFLNESKKLKPKILKN